MSYDKLPVSFSRETLNEVKSLLRGADPDAPLVNRLRNPRTPYSPARLREEAADRIEALTAERDALKAAQIDAIRAALEAAAEVAANEADYVPVRPDNFRKAIRALDPAAIAAKLKGDWNERA